MRNDAREKADIPGSLMRANLIDEYILLIHPLVLGSGRLFPGGEYLRRSPARRGQNDEQRRSDRNLPTGLIIGTVSS